MRQYQNILGDLLHISEKIFPTQQHQIEEKARILLEKYCKEEVGKPKEITMHTIKKIFPCIAFYKSVTECTGQRDRAYAVIDEYFKKQCAVNARQLQRLCRIPFAYRFVPRIMALVIHKCFGEKSGFEMTDYETKGRVCHINMTSCPYFSKCQEYGCPELTTVFCDADDVAYGNMHRRLSWERSKTLGRGNEYCDFIIKIKNDLS